MVIGQRLPEILGKDQDGKEWKLSDFKGKKLVLYVYPKDSTPGCTSQACNLRDNYQALLDQGYAILGVSVQDAASHRQVIEKDTLPLPLIADTELKLVNELGVWGEKSLYGRKYMGHSEPPSSPMKTESWSASSHPRRFGSKRTQSRFWANGARVRNLDRES